MDSGKPEWHGYRNLRAGRETGQGRDDVRTADGEDQVGVGVCVGRGRANSNWI